MNEALYRAYFVEGKNLSSPVDLALIAQEFGIDPVKVEALFNTDIQQNELENDVNEARTLRIAGVPFFLFEDGTSIKGAQPISVFKDKLMNK